MKKYCFLCKHYTTPRICAIECKRSGNRFEYSDKAKEMFEDIKKNITDNLNPTDEIESEIIEMINETVGKITG